MMSTCLMSVLALILTLCTGISMGQCPEKCKCTGLQVDCQEQQLQTIPLSLPAVVYFLSLYKNQIRNISRESFKGLTQLRELNLAYNLLETIDDGVFEEVPNLETLYLYNNQIRNISRESFKGLTQLHTLHLSNNRLESIDAGLLEGVPNILYLGLSHNHIRNISRESFKGLTQLHTLELYRNRLESIDAGVFEGVPNITQLILHNNQIRNISRESFKGLTQLRTLYLYHNLLESIDAGVFEGVPNITELYLWGNQIRNISRESFKGLTQLRTLDLSNNRLESIDAGLLEGVPNISDLYLNHNQIRNIYRESFKGLTQLRTLLLHDNRLESIDAGVFEGVPNITTLYLYNNQIRNISRESFKGLTQLRTLYLSNNRLEYIDAGVLEGVPNISDLWLANNPLICDCKLRWLIEAVQVGQFTLNDYALIKCSQPAHMNGRAIAKITLVDLNCSTQTNDINECATAPCKNGATCTNLQNAYLCRCSPGWQGSKCDQDINECAPAPCKNGATCTNLQNAYSCRCSPGWQGNNCDQDINECAPVPCKNGATCTNVQNAYSCTCSPGWQGNNYINECAPAPCKNVATCTNLQNAYSCTCAPGWQGNNCDQDAAPGNELGKFGWKFRFSCNCADGADCGRQNGYCQNGCKPGFYGWGCQFADDRIYGERRGTFYTGSHVKAGNETCMNWSNPHIQVHLDNYRFLDKTIPGAVCRNPLVVDKQAYSAYPWCYIEANGVITFGECTDLIVTVCPDYLYGDRCDQECHCSNITEVCDKNTGFCKFSKCHAGWFRIGCDMPCPPTKFGIDCAYDCGNCLNNLCDHETGLCTIGCRPGFSGTHCIEEVSTSPAPESQPTVISTTESSTLVYIGTGLGIFALIAITVAVFVIITKNRRQNTRRPSMADADNMPNNFPLQIHEVRSNPLGSEYLTLGDRDLTESYYHHIEDLDMNSSEYDDVDIVRETNLQTSRELPPENEGLGVE